MLFTSSEKKILFQSIRQFFYLFLTMCVILSLWGLAKVYHERTFMEFGIVENIQLSFLLLSGIFFLGEGYLFKKDRAILFLLASFCCLGFCRELDSFFDQNLPIISWKFGFLFPIAALINIYRNRREARKSFFYFLETPAFQLMCMAVIIGLVVAQVLGHRTFIETVLGPAANARAVRRLMEEGIEVVSYFLILMSAVECYWNFSKKK